MDGRENICGPGELGRSVLRPYTGVVGMIFAENCGYCEFR